MENLQNRITAVDIVRHVGLAPNTVSHVLAGRAERVRIKAETQRYYFRFLRRREKKNLALGSTAHPRVA